MAGRTQGTVSIARRLRAVGVWLLYAVLGWYVVVAVLLGVLTTGQGPVVRLALLAPAACLAFLLLLRARRACRRKHWSLRRTWQLALSTPRRMRTLGVWLLYIALAALCVVLTPLQRPVVRVALLASAAYLAFMVLLRFVQACMRGQRLTLSILRWTPAALVCLVYVLLASTQIYLLATGGRHFSLTLLCVGIVLAPVLLALLGRLGRRRDWDRRRVRRLVVESAYLLLGGFLVYLADDAPPIEDDYTWEQAPVPEERAEESFQALLAYRHRGSSKRIPSDKLPRLRDPCWRWFAGTEPAAQVQKVWDESQEARDYIAHLDTYDGIADLATTVSSPILSFNAWRSITGLYHAYALVQVRRGRPEEGARELAQFHSVTRKILPYPRTLVFKMVMTSTAVGNIDTAYEIATDPRCTRAAVRMLRPSFTPLTDKETALRTVVLGEYLSTKSLLRRGPFRHVSPRNLRRPGPLAWFWASVDRRFTLDPNRTIRDLHGVYEPLIERAPGDWPALREVEQAEERARVLGRPSGLKNVWGRAVLRTYVPSLRQAYAACRRTRVKSDLLAIVLSNRLGEKPQARDDFTGEAYLVDETEGVPFSAGPDGEPGTEDDITLGFGK